MCELNATYTLVAARATKNCWRVLMATWHAPVDCIAWRWQYRQNPATVPTATVAGVMKGLYLNNVDVYRSGTEKVLNALFRLPHGDVNVEKTYRTSKGRAWRYS